MSSSKTDIVTNLSRFVWGKCTVSEFESWLYVAPGLEEQVEEEAYLELISADYQSFQSQLKARRLAASIVAAKAPEVWDQALESGRRRLAAEIKTAFADVSRGDGVSLHQAHVMDRRGSEAQEREARNLDLDTRWQDVPASDIATYSGILPFLDMEGFLYYIPAYMLWTVENLLTSDSDSIFFTICAFTSGHAPNRQVFSEHQAQVVGRFLWYVALACPGYGDDISYAIEADWGFCWEVG